MRPYTVNVTGSASEEYSSVIPVDWTQDNAKIGFSVCPISGTGGTVTLQETFDDVQAPDFNPSTACWIDNVAFTSVATTVATPVDGNVAFPVRAIRLQLDATFNGEVKFTVIQTSGD